MKKYAIHSLNHLQFTDTKSLISELVLCEVAKDLAIPSLKMSRPSHCDRCDISDIHTRMINLLY